LVEYGISFRSLRQAVQGAALGVAAIFCVGESAPLYARERAIVQAPPYAPFRHSTAMARVLAVQEGWPPEPADADSSSMAWLDASGTPFLSAPIAPGLAEAGPSTEASDAHQDSAQTPPLVIDWDAPIAPRTAAASPSSLASAREADDVGFDTVWKAAIGETSTSLNVDVDVDVGGADWLGDAGLRRRAVIARAETFVPDRAICGDCLHPRDGKFADQRGAAVQQTAAIARGATGVKRGRAPRGAANAIPNSLRPGIALRFGPSAPVTTFDLPTLPADMINLACVVAAQNRAGPPCFSVGSAKRVGRDAAASMRRFPAFEADVSASPWLGDGGRRRAALLARPEASELGMASLPTGDVDDDGAVLPSEAVTGIDGADGQASETDLLAIKTLPRGGIAFSGGYSSLEGPVGTVKIARTNIGAPGRDISASVRYSKIQRLFEFGLADANFMGRKLLLAPTFFYSRSTAVGFDAQSKSSVFRQTARGVNFYAAKPFGRGLRVAANYRYSDEDFLIRQQNARCDVGLHGSPFCNALGRSTSSVLSVGLTLDRRNRAVGPTRGFQLRFTPEIAGPGGTSRFVRFRAAGSFHRRIGDMLDVSLGLEGGVMEPIGGRTIPLFDRFYIGGNSMRGFDLRGIGPKVVPLKAPVAPPTAIGGRAYYAGRLEVAFRVEGAMQKFGVTPSVFVDAGSVFGASKNELIAGERLIGNSAKPRVAVGLGLAFNAGPGQLRFSLAQPVVRQEGDRSRKFSISLGTAF
jgi:hypothetical protein